MVCFKKSCNRGIAKKTTKKPSNQYLPARIQFNDNTPEYYLLTQLVLHML